LRRGLRDEGFYRAIFDATDLAYMKELVSYWRDTFNWRTQEQRLNRFPQFKMNIDGLDLHFIHQRAKASNAVPLVLLHGYPDSFVTFTKVIDALVDPASHGGQPEEAFHVIVPSLPGYGFSERPRQRGWGAARAAAAVTTLMARLGYTRYAVQGAGLGCVIGTRMALDDRAHVLAEHFNDCSVPAPPGDPDRRSPPPIGDHVAGNRCESRPQGKRSVRSILCRLPTVLVVTSRDVRQIMRGPAASGSLMSRVRP
jgi:pimeloyl-ACP methyl ester carboxylesterase